MGSQWLLSTKCHMLPSRGKRLPNEVHLTCSHCVSSTSLGAVNAATPSASVTTSKRLGRRLNLGGTGLQIFMHKNTNPFYF